MEEIKLYILPIGATVPIAVAVPTGFVVANENPGVAAVPAPRPKPVLAPVNVVTTYH